MPTFETGATTAAANNLVLSVLNDGAIYMCRLHIGFAELQNTSHQDITWRDLCAAEATKQRTIGGKFKAAEISEAAKLVRAATLESCKEIFACEYDSTKQVIATCRRWFDSVNGNSYFSVWVGIPTAAGFRSFVVPFQYGYGSQWQYETVNALVNYGVLQPFPKYDNGNTKYGYLSELPIIWRDVGYGLKKHLF